ncbi:adhesion G protein-coupled receptor E5 isoform X2 [Garra rufa]|uniref:adhesion G protein-coupled receptor E5 isoform X2 n=1 Tax=Garra rufa TaxID=137080 RepID=UPI003CCEBA27
MRHAYLLSLGLLLTLTENILMNNCKPGYKKQNRECVDEDECDSNPSICGNRANCFNTDGSYYCQCHKGFTPTHNFTQGDSIKCIDRDECEVDPSICGKHATCHNTPGSSNCSCDAGFRLKSGETKFTDLYESCESVCELDKSICGGGVCKNSKDGHECECNSGFTNYGHKQMKCTELRCDTLLSESDASRAPPELVSLMTNSCLGLSGSVSKEPLKQGEGERHLEAFLRALDDLLSSEFGGDNAKVSAMFSIVESMLKLIGPLLSESQTRRSNSKTDLEMLVERGSSPPEGHFMMNTSGALFTSHWDTATGNNHLGFTTAALLSYKGLEKSLNRYFNNLEKKEKQTFKINSQVVTATVSNKETAELNKPVKVTFSHLKETNEEHICVFWDHNLEGGAWSTHGCTKVNSSADQTVCSCTHLSSFAVLLALYDIGDVFELRLLTLVGLPLSLLCFLICITTFYFVRSIQSTRNTIHLHLCISLFIGYFVFLVGITRTENKVGCSVVAGILHYFFLASFCWMCLEGVQLFRMVVLVFNTTLRPIYMFAAGYGVPAVILAISASVNSSGYGTDNHCWLKIEDGSIWSFYGPVCVIIIVNVFFFLITIWKLAEKFSSLNPDLDSLRKIKAFTVTAVAQLCILGITWVFGLFQLNENTLPMSYIFTILSCLQGVLMFILHCWLSKPVREEYAKFISCICVPQKRKYTEFSSNQTSKSQTSKSVQHTGESNI